jgi:uncharacterized protein YkwD
MQPDRPRPTRIPGTLRCLVLLLVLLPPGDRAARGADEDPFLQPMDAFARRADVRQPIDPGSFDRRLLAAAVFHETNLRRAQHRMRPLQHEERLDRAAGMQADIMARRNELTHVNPDEPNRRTPAERVRASGLTPAYVSENVATHFGIRYRPGTPAYPSNRGGRRVFSTAPGGPPIPAHTFLTFARSLLDQWMDSPGHRANILAKRAGRMGAGCTPRPDPQGMDTWFCAQVFASKE